VRPRSPHLAAILTVATAGAARGADFEARYDRIGTAAASSQPADVSPGVVTSIVLRLRTGAEGEELTVAFECSDWSAFRVRLIGDGVGDYVRIRSPAPRTPPLRYLLTHGLHTDGADTLDFVDARTDRARMPVYFDRASLVPKCIDPGGKALERITFLGEPYELGLPLVVIDDSAGKTRAVPPRRLVLDDDVLIGASRNVRNRRHRRRYHFGPDYEYVPFSEDDYRRMAEAGFNYFTRVSPEQYEWVLRLPAFFVIDDFEEDGVRVPFPEVLYHPGFPGAEDFVDEPAYLMNETFADAKPGRFTLDYMAKHLEQRVATLFTRGGRGRGHSLAKRLEWAGLAAPPGVETITGNLPIWEEHFSTACYQLRTAGNAFIHEGRYDFPYVPAILNEFYRTDIPRTPEAMLTIYYAFLRGAARVAGKDWGTSIYGQADPAHARLALRTAYDRGARYLWFWSSDKSHHLPFEEQLDLARGLRDYVEKHPRPPRADLIRGAEVAVVLPYGFTFPIDDWNKRRIPDVWRSTAFPLDGGRLPSGVSYYAVLQAAARRMEDLIRAGREFDVVIDVPELKDAGYADLIPVITDAEASQ